VALPLTHFITAVEGVICVASRGADWTEPRYIVNHFPTVRTVSSFCRDWEVEADKLRGVFMVSVTMPGEFLIWRPDQPARRVYLPLVEGARTKSIAVTFEEVEKPKVGKTTKLEWESGRWRIYPPKGKPRTVEV
jgi:hypothetical protein